MKMMGIRQNIPLTTSWTAIKNPLQYLVDIWSVEIEDIWSSEILFGYIQSTPFQILHNKAEDPKLIHNLPVIANFMGELLPLLSTISNNLLFSDPSINPNHGVEQENPQGWIFRAWSISWSSTLDKQQQWSIHGPGMLRWKT